MQKKIPPINYDESWKYILTYMFKNGSALFYKAFFKLIDFTKPVDFIESKLINLDVGLDNNSKIASKLIQCFLLDSSTQHVLLHIEIEFN